MGGKPSAGCTLEVNRLIHIYFKWVPSVGVGWMSVGNTQSYCVCMHVFVWMQISAGQRSVELMTTAQACVFALLISAGLWIGTMMDTCACVCVCSLLMGWVTTQGCEEAVPWWTVCLPGFAVVQDLWKRNWLFILPCSLSRWVLKFLGWFVKISTVVVSFFVYDSCVSSRTQSCFPLDSLWFICQL